MSIGINIKKRRFELKMSQQELADALGYKTRSTIAKIESEENSITYKKLQQVAEVLDTTVENLVSGDTNKDIPAQTTSKSNKSKNICIILAGGKSTRNQQNIPNQFIDINGKPLIMYPIEAYQIHPAISEIYIVCLKGWENILLSYIKQYNIDKFVGIIPGGNSGIDSIKNAIEFISNSTKLNDIVILQESTRPLVTQEMISKTINSTLINNYAITTESMNDYLQFTTYDNVPKYVDRSNIVCLQSPESYKFKILKEAFKNKTHNETCCAMFMYNNNYKLKFIEGNYNNIKIIRQEDILILESLLKFNSFRF